MLPNDHQKQLNSWKEIAGVLGVSVRTTQKWESQRGLSVMRTAGNKGRVSADAAELEHWKQAHLRKKGWWDNPSLLRAYAFVATLVVLVLASLGVAGRLSERRKGPPALSHLESNTLVVADSQGRELWRKA